MDMIHIDRSKRTEAWNKVAGQGRRLFAQGTWVIMFPEGTRIERGRRGTYKAGASRLAIDAGVPIPSAGRRPDELMAQVEAWIEAEMQRLDPEAYRPAAG